MKLYDFGLWFKHDTWRDGEKWEARWSTAIHPLPPRLSSYERRDEWNEDCYFEIFYDGVELGFQWHDLDLDIYTDKEFIIKLKNLNALKVSTKSAVDLRSMTLR